MGTAEEISKAIGAHGMWKQRLANAIATGRSDFVPEKVAPDNLCDFGKWLYALPPSDRSSDQWKQAQALHAAFHQEAAVVLRLIQNGQKSEAEKSVALGGAYATASAKLTTAMMNWKKTLET